MNIRAITLVLALGLGIVAFATPKAEAIPAFSKKYEAQCTVCHSAWPRLNKYGMHFKLNGYQLPGTTDGNTKEKLDLGADLLLDINRGSPPISALLHGGATVLEPDNGPGGVQNDKYFCCYDDNDVTLQMGGTIAGDIGYWVSLPWARKEVEQGYIRYTNWFGPGYLGLDFGAMNVLDLDASPAGREWFSAPKVAFFGAPYSRSAVEIGQTAAHNDIGLRLYGNPGYNMFTYEIGLYTGNKILGTQNDDDGMAYTAMGRINKGMLAFSLRYWSNSGGAVDVAGVSADGVPVVFVADSGKNDESTDEFIITARYQNDDIDIDLTIDMVTFGVGDRSFTDVDGVEHTLVQENMVRTGVSLGAIWRANKWLELGLSYGTSMINEYKQAVDGVTTVLGNEETSILEIKASFLPTMNSRIGISLQADLSNAESRTLSDGVIYDKQNRVIITYALSF